MSPKKILLIDDEHDIRIVAGLSLRRVGKFEVATAENGEEGLVKIKADPPDLVLLDMMMPGMDGLTVFDRILADPLTKNIPVIFLTARVQATEKEKYIARGARGVIEKPFNPMLISQQVLDLLPERETVISAAI
ncbi:MAG: response regulator [bacterium]